MADGCSSCAKSGSCSSAQQAACEDKDAGLKARLSQIKHKIVVLSGKGGVGKSTVAVNMAMALALAGKQTGLLDVDVHGPSVPRLLGLKGQRPQMGETSMTPVQWREKLAVMSMGFLTASDDDAIIWRGPAKIGVIRQFVEATEWGTLDYLLTDCPPGTGDEPMTALQTLGTDAHAVIVTTPQSVAIDDVRRSISFCSKLGNPILGLVENMSGFVCPDCGSTHDIFQSGTGAKLAEETNIPFLGRIPFDPDLARSGDAGEAYLERFAESATAMAMQQIVTPILALDT